MQQEIKQFLHKSLKCQQCDEELNAIVNAAVAEYNQVASKKNAIADGVSNTIRNIGSIISSAKARMQGGESSEEGAR